ncbi:zinc finger protein-like 1 [Chrysoperla carnea]|uniref:zinc finger protein-like 1 n=1 Tax=Chrysoperla carnea TaxID=189513 RepID=UPI001D068DC2|nr:zinc finger protein-like 1 [Chrysoperla carnea]
MGLCKCPQRRMTNQFCFQHKSNVCEYCMIHYHPKCIVQSYLQWLQDSDYDPICQLCKTKELEAEDCIRLTCYHVFHWSCLDSWARNLPSDTAPAGYKCPSCYSPLFPPPNLISPVADVLKEKLAGVNWARTGLGLPLLTEHGNESKSRLYAPISIQTSNLTTSSSTAPASPHSIVHVPDVEKTVAFSRTDTSNATSAPRRTHLSDTPILSRDMLFDHDENKYKRRPPGEWLLRKWKSIWSPGRGRRHWRPFLAITIALLIALFILGMIGRYSIDDNDPAFDVRQNPQVKSIDNR